MAPGCVACRVCQQPTGLTTATWPGVPWAGIGLVLGSLLLPWVVMSCMLKLPLFFQVRQTYVFSIQKSPETFQRRQLLAAESAQVVAVTLSGGGYRAALTHAGLLWMLDQAQVPIHMLSTVSGGSIIGAAYAAGWSPEHFKKALQATSPGLPNDLLSLSAVVSQLVNPHWGSGDIYERHFDRVYFRELTLEQTELPTLIVNVTAYRDGARVVFWKEGSFKSCDEARVRGADTQQAKTLPLARLVAASGAFPIAFEPVSISRCRYVDGGLVDNLGVEGLREYLTRAQPERYPDVLIISDLGAGMKPPRPRYKPSPLQMATHGWALAAQATQQWLYWAYTAGRYQPHDPQ